jgi:hypothetical protein
VEPIPRQTHRKRAELIIPGWVVLRLAVSANVTLLIFEEKGYLPGEWHVPAFMMSMFFWYGTLRAREIHVTVKKGIK